MHVFFALMGTCMGKRSLCVWGLTAPYAPCFGCAVSQHPGMGYLNLIPGAADVCYLMS